MQKLKVYDSKNPERLLGTLAVPENFYGEYYRVHCGADLRVAMAYMADDNSRLGEPVADALKTVEFRKEWRTESSATRDGPFDRTIVRREWAVLLTDAPLADLLKIDRFVVDGQSVLAERLYGRRF